MAELEELGVGIFKQLNSRFSTCGSVIEKGGIPTDDGEVRGVIGDAGLQDFVTLLRGQRQGIAADDLGDTGAVGGDEVGCVGRAGSFADLDDEVVLGEPFRVWLDESGGSSLKASADHDGGMGGEVDLPCPAAGEGDQGLPRAREREMENDTDDTIVVVLDLS